jgi:DNA-binding response OmpR family regulator
MDDGTRPEALLVEDTLEDARSEAEALQHAGFQVFHAQSVAAGYEQAEQLLAQARHRARPCAVVLDLRMPVPANPELDASLLALILKRRVRQGRMRQPWLFGITFDLSPEREQRARYCGCDQVFIKPFAHRHARALFQTVQTEELPRLVEPDYARHLLEGQAEQLLEMLRLAEAQREWAVEDVVALLALATHYRDTKPPNDLARSSVLLRVGGELGARALLHDCVQRLDADDPLRRLLIELLRGRDRSALDRVLIGDRSTIHRQLKRLPERLAELLR